MADEGLDINGAPLKFVAQLEDDEYLKSIDSVLAANRKLHEQEMRRFKQNNEAAREFINMQLKGGEAFKDFADSTRRQLDDLSGLQREMARIAEAKNKLNTAYAAGNSSMETYQQELGALTAEESKFAQAISEVGSQLAKSDNFQRASNALLSERKSQVEQLAAAYEKMGTTGQQTDTGKALASNIAAIRTEITGLEQAFTAINQSAFANLPEEIKQLNAIEERYTQIARLQNDLSKVQVAKTELNDNFAEQQKNAQNYRLERTKLIEQEELLRTQINATKASLRAMDAQYDQGQQKIQAEIKELAKLQAAYDALNSTEIKTPAGNKLKTDISALEKSVQRGQDAETRILQERTAAAAQLQQQYEELSRVKVHKVDLKTDFGDGQKYITTYRQELEKLNATEKELSATIARETIAAQRYESVSKSVALAVALHTAEVAKLQAAYDNLSTVDQADPQIGGKLKSDMAALEQQIESVRQGIINLPELKLDTLPVYQKQLTDLDDKIGQLKDSLANMPATQFDIKTNGELEEQIKKIAELKTRLESLPEKEQINISVGGKISDELKQIEAQTTAIVGKIIGIPDLSLGNLDAEITKLKQLETILESLSEEEIQAGRADILIKDIDQAEDKVKLLSTAINAVPELTLGNVQERINELLQLKNTAEGVKLPALEFGDTLKKDIDETIVSLQTVKRELSQAPEIPPVMIQGIDENIRSLEKLKAEIVELEKVQGQKISLTNNFDQSAGDVAAYQAQLSQLTEQENALTQSISQNTAALQRNNQENQTGLQDLEQKQARLESLRLSYAQLADVEKQTGKGIALGNEIEKAKKEVDALAASLQNVSLGEINTSGLAKVKEDYRDLLAIQKQLGEVETAKLNLDKTDVVAYTSALAELEKQENELVAAFVKSSDELKKNESFQNAGNEIIAEKTRELTRLKSAYNNLPKAAKLDAEIGGNFKAEIDALEKDITGVNALLNKVPDNAFGAATQSAEGFKKNIQSLKIEMQSYKAIVEKSTDPAIIKRYNAEIARLATEIRQVRNAGREGFDALGRPMKEQLSILGRLEKAARLYQSAIKSATNPENLAKYNRKLEDTEEQIRRISNQGRDGFDTLGNAIGKSTNVAGKLWNGLKQVAQFLPGIGLIGLIDLVTEPLLAWIKSLDLFKAKVDEAKEARKSFNDVMVKGAQSAQQEITQLKTLFAVAKDTTISMEKRRDAVKTLQDLYPDYLGNIRTEVILAGNAQAAYDKLSASILATGRARAAQDKITENASLRLDNEQKLIDLQQEQIKNEEKLAEARKFANEANKSINTGTAAAGLGNITAGRELFLAQKRVDDNLKEQEKTKKENNRLDKESLRLAGEINKQVKKGADLTPDKDNTGIDDYLKRYEDMMQRLRALQDKYQVKNLSPDDAARKALNDEFKKLAFDINQFNRNPKNKIKIDVQQVETLRVEALNDLIYRQDTEKLKVEIERQKGFFLAYENYRTALGKEKADERFRGEKAEFDTYKEYLVSEIRKITALNIPADKMTDGMRQRLESFTKNLEEVNQSEKASFDKFYTDLAAAALSYNQKIALINEDFRAKEEKLRANSSGPDLERELGELENQKNQKIEIVKDEAFQRTKIYQKLNEEVIRYTKDQAKAQIEATKAALKNADISAALREQLETDLNDFEVLLKVGIDESYIRKLQDRKKLLEDSLKNEKLSTAEIKQQRKELADIIQALGSIDLTWRKLFGFKKIEGLDDAAGQANLLRNTVGLISQGFRNASNSVREMNSALADSLDTAADIGDIATDYFSAGAAILSGDFGGALQSTLSYLQKGFDFLFSAPKRTAQEAKRQIEVYNRQQYDAEFSINQLYRERLRVQQDINTETLRGLKEQARLLGEQAKKSTNDYQKVLEELQRQQYVSGQKTEKYGGVLGIGQKTRTVDILTSLRGKNFEELEALFLAGKLTERAAELFKILEKLKAEGADIDALLEENRKKAQEIALGISSDSFIDAFANLFKEGRPSIEKLADFFTETMSNAALSIFKSEYLATAMKELYQKLADAAKEDSEGGIVITDAERKKLKEFYDALSQQAIGVYEDLMEITGAATTNKSNSKNSLQGEVERMTQETGTIIAGALGGIRISGVQTVERLDHIVALLAGGKLFMPAAGNTTFSVPGMLEVAANTGQMVGLQQQTVMTGYRQVELMMDQLNVARQTAANTGETAINTRRLQAIESTLKNIERNQSSSSNALGANGIRVP